MEIVKNQHYVPRSYLRRFTNDDRHTFVYDKVTGKTFRSAVENIASERFFYDISSDELEKMAPGAGIDPQFVEKGLSAIESQFQSTLGQLLSCVEQDGITPDLKREMIPFITYQILRTRDARNELVELHKAMNETFVSILGGGVFPDESDNANAVSEAFLHWKYLLDPEMIAEVSAIFERHIWFIGFSRTSGPLYTSDHPVVKQPHVYDPRRGYGLGSTGIELAFPLTSRHVLVMADRTAFAALQVKENQVLILDTEAVKYYNSLQVSQSHRQVYCEYADFTLAKDMCRENPQLQTLNRKRVSVNGGHRPPDS